MKNFLRAASTVTLLGTLAAGSAYGQVFTDFELTDANTVIDTMNLGIPRLRNIEETDLVPGATEFSYATRSFAPMEAGDYLIGNFSAGFDTAILLYKDSFDPDNPGKNFMAFNDDWGDDRSVLHTVDGQDQFIGFSGFDTGDIEDCDRPQFCPVVVASLDEARSYQIVVSQYNPDDDFDLSDPIRLFVFGPGGAWFELPSSILERALAQSGATENQISVARVLDDEGRGHPLFDAVDAIFSDSAFLGALGSLSGATHAAHQTALLDQSLTQRGLIFARIRDAMGQTSGSPALGYSGRPAVNAPGDRRVWGSLYGGFARLNENGRPGADTRSAGVVAGADDWLGKFRLGLYAGLGRTGTSANARQATLESTDVGLGVYGGTQSGQTRLSFGAGYQRHIIDSSRTVAFPGFSETLEASYGGGTAQVFAELGHSIDLDPATSLEPFTQLAFVHQYFDSFSESGGLSALTVDAQHARSMIATLGVRGEHQFILGQDMLVTLSGSVAWQNALVEDGAMMASFSGGTPFSIDGVTGGGQAMLLEAGLDLDLNETTDLELSYRGALRSDTMSHDFQASFAVRF